MQFFLSVLNCILKCAALCVLMILIMWVNEMGCQPSPCPFSENPGFLKCGIGHSTSGDEAVISRGTSNTENHVSNWSSVVTSPQPLLLLFQYFSPLSKYRQCYWNRLLSVNGVHPFLRIYLLTLGPFEMQNFALQPIFPYNLWFDKNK